MILRLKRVLLLAVVTPLESCMTITGSLEPVVPDRHNLSYIAPEREWIHLTQAFDDGAKTYLQFDDAPLAGIEIRDPKCVQAMTYNVDECYLIVPGVERCRGRQVGHRHQSGNAIDAKSWSGCCGAGLQGTQSQPCEE